MIARPVVRSFGAAAAVVLAAVGLTACTKPVPQVTFQTGSTSTVAAPSNYCFDLLSHCHSNGHIATVHAKPNSTIFVDVPHDIAVQHWIVTAFNVNGKTGKSTPIQGAGSVGILHNTHNVRVSVPNGSGAYYLSVAELRGPIQSGTWTVFVQISE